jgi:hypothetical protein
MGGFLIFYRLICVAIVVFWVAALLTTRGKPPDWRPPRSDRIPGFRISRDFYRIAAVLGIIAGLGVFAWSFVLEGFAR